MAAEETIATPLLGTTEDGCSPSEEQMALIDFAYRLGAFNVPAASGIAADEEGNTRQEAKLLMSLLASPLKLGDDEEDLEPVSASESERSFGSASSSASSSYSRRDNGFAFTCPSLSLENSKAVERPLSLIVPTPSKGSSESFSSSPSSSHRPAALLGRTLTVDDRDALRLSADAMARNVSQSFQKAVGWRVQAWIATLSASLLNQTGGDEAASAGGDLEQQRRLAETSEAALILHLRAAAESIQVTATRTSFQVGPQQQQQSIPPVSPSGVLEGEPAPKKQRLEGDHQPPDLEEGDYVYRTSYGLQMECVVSLQTPAGFSEVTMQVPGVIEGTFLSTETGMEELRSVNLELDTNILAAMVEKSCRTVVRASVEALAASGPGPVQSEAPCAPLVDLASPTPCYPPTITSEADFRSALVTPRATNLSEGTYESFPSSYMFSSPQPMLRPIPDDIDDKSSGPRRISPPLHVTSTELTPHHSYPTQQPYHQLPHHHLAPRTPKTQSSYPLPSLVSPPPNEYQREVPANGPSLPMLVEVACRVLHK